MKGKLSTLGLGLVLVALLAGCTLIPISGSGKIVTREETFTGFDKLDISWDWTVDVRQGETFSVVVRVDDNLVKYLQVIKEGNTLKIGLMPDQDDRLWDQVYYQVGDFRNATRQAEITMPELAGLDVAAGCDVAVTGFESTKSLELDVFRGSHVTLTGSAGDVTIDAFRGSEVDLSGFSVVNANVKARDGSEVTVNVSGRLDADASGGANIYYLGSPTLGKIDTSGASSVKRK
jgi:hypothetical protein